jgi:uncharacterized protein with HEPN domain
VPSSDPLQRFQDILKNIERIERYTGAMNSVDFREGGLVPDAVERCFERICEAAKKLGDLAEELCPDIRWYGIRGFGNFLRHEYDSIELDLLWAMGERDLPPLKIAVRSALAVLPGK